MKNPTYHNCAKCPTKSRGHFVSGLSPFHPSFSFSRNLVQIQSWHGAIKPELGELLGVTGSVATKPHHSSDSKTKQGSKVWKIRLNFQGLWSNKIQPSKVWWFDSKVWFLPIPNSSKPPEFRHLFTLLLHLLILSSKFLTKIDMLPTNIQRKIVDVDGRSVDA